MKEVTPEQNILSAQLAPLTSGLMTFDISNRQHWSNVPEFGGKAFVNGQYTSTHRSVESGKDCYDWALSQKFPIDHKKKYEFSIWIMSTTTDLNNYLGFFAYDQSGAQIRTGTINNPYFKGNQNDPPKWVRWNGFVMPSTGSSKTSDINKPPQDIPSYFSNGVDWKWPASATHAVIRFGSCYGDGDNQGISFFALPQVFESDLYL
jgi:hypothetical protein